MKSIQVLTPRGKADELIGVAEWCYEPTIMILGGTGNLPNASLKNSYQDSATPTNHRDEFLSKHVNEYLLKKIGGSKHRRKELKTSFYRKIRKVFTKNTL